MVRVLYVVVLAAIACTVIGWALIQTGRESDFVFFLFDYGSLASSTLPCLLAPALILRDPIDKQRVEQTFVLAVLLVGCFVAWLGTKLIMTGGAGSPRFIALLGPAMLISLTVNSALMGVALGMRKLGVRIKN